MKMAVYGTLRGGLGNNGYLRRAEYLGTGLTVDKYTLRASGIPYVGKEPTHRVEVEVWDVKEESDILAIDMLEGHPRWYKREEIAVELNDGTILKAWLYFMESSAKIVKTGNYLDYDAGNRQRSIAFWKRREELSRAKNQEDILNNEAF